MSNLFREKSMERISSPEQLNAYIRVATPSVWMVLSAVIVLLVGVCVWGMFGHLDTTLTVAAVCDGEMVTAYVREADAAKVAAQAQVLVGQAQGRVTSVAQEPVRVDESFGEYMRHVGALQLGEWVYAVTLDVVCAQGVFPAKVVIESVSPLSFVLN